MLKASLIAPAGKCPPENIKLALQELPSYGIEPHAGVFINTPHRYLAANDDQRLHDLESAWNESTNDLVLCLRGGYGCARLLESIDWHTLKQSQNILVGHSDISALHLAFFSKGIGRTVSGIMAAAEFIREPDEGLTLKSFFHCLEAKPFEHKWQAKELKTGTSSGPLIPVTLSVLCSLLGSNFLPSFKNTILVLEDIGEAPYKVDRLLCQLKLAGILDELSGLVFGDFNNCGSEDELQEIFEEYSHSLNIPVAQGLPFGHCQPRLNLPVGGEARLDVTVDSAKLSVLKYN